MADIVERLRDAEDSLSYRCDPPNPGLLDEAADEILRLRAEAALALLAALLRALLSQQEMAKDESHV